MQIQQKEVKMKKMILMCIALSFTMACSKKDEVKPPVVDPVVTTPTPGVIETPTPSATATPVPVAKGHIVISGDFSPMCPAKPGFVPPLAGEACDIGFKACSSGLVYTCESGMKSMMMAGRCIEIDGVKYCKNPKK
jgi:hypothetical protein